MALKEESKSDVLALVLDTDGKVKKYNFLVSKILNEDEESVIGKKVDEVIERIKDNIEDEIDMKFTLEPLLNNKEEIYGHLALGFRASISEDSEVTIASLAHEFKNPLTNIRGMAQLIKLKLNNDECNCGEMIDYLKKLINEIDYLNILANDFLEYKKNTKLDDSKVLLNDVIEETLFLIEQECEAEEVEINYTLKQKRYVCCSFEHVKQVLLNIIKNAIEAFDDANNTYDKKIKIEVKPTADKDYNIIIISDNGPGIKDEVLAEIFNPFYTTKDYGTGLGLSTCKKIIEEHGGKIEVNSCEEGTKFMVYLPR
ncbi:MAG: PAS/PAC sensor signal transduction histidine kinase [Candidatus Frackibacter sp. T328-2]|nr:MAG: PAS/PAC sensor signal transduction histidine kinase [Candidatus Frackibacter sp. T328-2]